MAEEPKEVDTTKDATGLAEGFLEQIHNIAELAAKLQAATSEEKEAFKLKFVQTVLDKVCTGRAPVAPAPDKAPTPNK